MNLFSKLFRSRDKPQNHFGGLSFLFGQMAAGKAVNERTAMQTMAVYACVHILAESIACQSRQPQGELYYTYTRSTEENPNFKDKGQIRLRRENVLHIPGLGFDSLVGYSPIARAKIAIGIALATEEYGGAFFKNGARPGEVLEHPGVLKDPSKLRESWHAVYGGTMNTGRIAVFEEGVKYQQITIPPEEAQFLETRKFQIDEIARLYRVPPYMISDLEKSSFNNIEQQSIEFVKYTLNPWVVRWEQSLQKALLTDAERSNYFIRFKVGGLLRGVYKNRMEGYAIERQNGWLSANDIRSLEDMNPIEVEEGGDLYLINGNMTTLRDAGLFAKKKGEGDET